MARQKTAVVVGAGAGGIATAARLAKAGFKVTVVEKNDFTGGRCSLMHHDGYVCCPLASDDNLALTFGSGSIKVPRSSYFLASFEKRSTISTPPSKQKAWSC